MRNNEASGSALMRVFKFGAREKLQNETARIFYTRELPFHLHEILIMLKLLPWLQIVIYHASYL